MSEQPDRGAAGPDDDTPPLGYARPAPIGPGDTPNVAGSNEQQPQLSGEPEPGIQPDESGGFTQDEDGQEDAGR